MASYPDWLMKYKTKGVYARRTKGGYALYRGHSERVAGRAYPRLVCDEYLGVATESGGLRPSSPPVKDVIKVKELGLWAVTDSLCGGLRRMPESHMQDGDVLFIRAFLACFGISGASGYGRQWISTLHPAEGVLRELSDDERTTVARLARQVRGRLKDTLGEDFGGVVGDARDVYAVFVNEGWHVSECAGSLKEKAKAYGISFSLGRGR
jgi:hypothetical protein